MKFRNLVAAAAMAALLVPGVAQANWKTTKWGQSVDDVVKAGKQFKVKRIADVEKDRVGNKQRLAVGEVTEGGVKFQVQFYFTPDGKSLQLVRYEPVEKMNCFDQEKLAVKLYGEGKPHDEVEKIDGGNGQMFDVNFHMRDWVGDGGDMVGTLHALIGTETTDVCTWTFEPAA